MVEGEKSGEKDGLPSLHQKNANAPMQSVVQGYIVLFYKCTVCIQWWGRTQLRYVAGKIRLGCRG